MKRLYIVRVEFEYAVMAENEREAVSFIGEAVNDDSTKEQRATATMAADSSYIPPEGWDDGVLVYGTDDDVTFAQAVAMDGAPCKGPMPLTCTGTIGRTTC